MKTWGLVVSLLLLLLSAGVHAEQSVEQKGIVLDPSQFPPPVELNLPNKYLASNGIAGGGGGTKETTKVVDGRTYTVMAPLFDGSDGNTTYLRLGNANNFSVAFMVLVVGNQSARTYGTAFYTIQPYSAPQIIYGDVLKKAGVTQPTGTDDGFAFYLYTGIGNTLYQHVIFSLNSLFFENASLCTFHDGLIYSPLNQIVVDIHTSLVASLGYPSVLFIHNYAPTTVTYTGYVFESESGTQKGSFSVTMGPNASYSFPWTQVEQAIGWTPKGAEGHANIGWVRADGQAFTAITGTSVYNQQFKAYVNMSLFCPINRD